MTTGMFVLLLNIKKNTNTLFTGNFIFLLMIVKNEILKKVLVHIHT